MKRDEDGPANLSPEQNGRVLAGINRLYRQALSSAPAEQLRALCLDVAAEVAGAASGFIAAISGEDGERRWSWTCGTDPLLNAADSPADELAPPRYDRLFQDGGTFVRTAPPLLCLRLGQEGFGSGVLALSRPDAPFRPAEIISVEHLAPVIADVIASQSESEALRRAAERQTFLLRLADALRPLANAEAIRTAVARLLGDHLGGDRTYFSEIDQGRELVIVRDEHNRRAAPTMIAEHDLALWRPFLDDMREGRCVVIDDVAADTRLEAEREVYEALAIRSIVRVPLLRSGELVGSLGIANVAPRRWHDDEVALLQDVAQRTWDALERARAEAALRASEARLDTVLEVLPTAVLIVDAAGRPVRGNAALRSLWGMPPAQVPHTGEVEWVGWWPGTGERIKPDEWAMNRALDRGETTWNELIQNQPFGSEERRQYLNNVAPLRDDQGRITGGVAAMLDVTEARRAEESLKESESRFRALAEQAEVGVAMTDRDGRLIWINERQAQIAGLARDELVGRTIETITHADDWPEHRRLFERMIATGEAFVVEERSGGSRPRPRWNRLSASPRRDAAGRIVGGIAIVIDITDRKRAEEAVTASERRLQTLVEGVPQLVWRAKGAGDWTWASPQWTAYTGQSEAASHGLGWLEPLHPDDRDIARDTWRDAVERGGFEVEYRIRDRDEGEYRWFQTRACPVRDRRGRVVEWLGTSTDVDELRRLQERQQVLVAELHHRVRNILTVVRSVFTRTIEAGGELDDIADHFKGRLDSLARTQVAAAQSSDGLVDLENLIRDELLSVGASDGPALTIGGPDIALSSKAAETIGLAIHELTTNSLKFGALKASNATLDIRWSVNMVYGGRRFLNLRWTEQGVPAISIRPARQGFGSELINEALPYRLGAETSLEFRGGGVRCSISVPLPEKGASAAPAWEEA